MRSSSGPNPRGPTLRAPNWPKSKLAEVKSCLPPNVKLLSLQSTSALQIRWHSSNTRVAAESTKILEAEKMRRIWQDELEKELQEVREEAERKKVGVAEVNPVAELEAELSRVRAQVPVQTQKFHVDPT